MTLAINVSKEDFLPALNSLQSITGKKGTMAILANILIQMKGTEPISFFTDYPRSFGSL